MRCAPCAATNSARRAAETSYGHHFEKRAFFEVQRSLGTIGRMRIVRHHDDGLAVLAVERLKQVENSVAGLAIEVAGGLVAQEQRRIGHNRARDADALLLAARELPRIVLRAIGKAHDLERDG